MHDENNDENCQMQGQVIIKYESCDNKKANYSKDQGNQFNEFQHFDNRAFLIFDFPSICNRNCCLKFERLFCRRGLSRLWETRISNWYAGSLKIPSKSSSESNLSVSSIRITSTTGISISLDTVGIGALNKIWENNFVPDWEREKIALSDRSIRFWMWLSWPLKLKNILFCLRCGIMICSRKVVFPLPLSPVIRRSFLSESELMFRVESSWKIKGLSLSFSLPAGILRRLCIDIYQVIISPDIIGDIMFLEIY